MVSLLTSTGGLAKDVLAEVFRHLNKDLFPFVRRFLLRPRRMHGVLVSLDGVFVSLDFIVTDTHVGVGACVTEARSLSSGGEHSSKAPIGLSPSLKPIQIYKVQPDMKSLQIQK